MIPIRLAAISLLASIALAQGGSHLVPWPPGAGQFITSAVGDFAGDGRQSAVVLRDQTLHYAFDPAMYTAFSPITTVGNVTAVARLPRLPSQPPPGGPPAAAVALPDTLLVCTTGGAVLGTYDTATRDFGFQSVLTAAWANATKLVVRGRAGGEATIAACAAGGQSVLVAERDASGIFVERALLTVSRPVLRAKIVDWNNDGTTDIALLADNGVYPFTTAGAALPPYPIAISDTAAAVVIHPQLGESLAWIQRQPTDCFLQLRNASVGSSTKINKSGLALGGPLNVTGLDGADMDGDGDTDLLLSQNGSLYALLIEIDPAKVAGASIPLRAKSQTAVSLAPATGAPSLNLCPGLWHDLDHSGIPDGLFWLDSGPSMLVLHELCATPSVNTTTPIVANGWYDGATLTLDIAQSASGGAPNLEIVVWHQANPIPAAPFVGPDGLRYRPVLPTAVGGYYRVSVPLVPTAVGSGPSWPNRDHYYLDIRFMDLATNTVRRSEVIGLTLQSFSLESPAVYMSYLRTLPPLSGSTEVPIMPGPPPPPPIPLMMTVGGIVTRKVPPPFATGARPGVN